MPSSICADTSNSILKKRFCKLGKLSLIASHKLRMVSLWFTNLSFACWSLFSLTAEGVRLRLNKKELLGTSGTSSAATVLTGSGVFSGFSSPELEYRNQVNVCPPKKNIVCDHGNIMQCYCMNFILSEGNS